MAECYTNWSGYVRLHFINVCSIRISFDMHIVHTDFPFLIYCCVASSVWASKCVFNLTCNYLRAYSMVLVFASIQLTPALILSSHLFHGLYVFHYNCWRYCCTSSLLPQSSLSPLSLLIPWPFIACFIKGEPGSGVRSVIMNWLLLLCCFTINLLAFMHINNCGQVYLTAKCFHLLY